MAESRRAGKRAPRDWLMAAEAAVWLAVAGVALRTLSFARLARLAAAAPSARSDASGGRTAHGIGRAIDAASRRAPWPVLCFEKGLAAHAMLRLRGLPSALYYGARNDPTRGPTAHVWVELAGVRVVGGDAAPDFAVLAAFPSLESAQGRRT
jgi:hypothetical protein